MKIRVLILIFTANILIAFFVSCVTHKGCPACQNNYKPDHYTSQKNKSSRKAVKSKSVSTATGNPSFKPAWDNSKKNNSSYTNEYKESK